MAYVLEVAGRSNVRLSQFLLLAADFGLPLSLGEGRVHDVVHLMTAVMVTRNTVDFWVFDVNRGHWQRWTIWRLASLLSFPLSSPHEVCHTAAKLLCLLLIGEIKTHLASISSECNKVRPGAGEAEAVVKLLFEHHLTVPEVEHPDVVGALGVVFDQTGHAAASLVPGGVPVCGKHLHHS